MASVGALVSKAAWVVTLARSYASVVVWLLLLAGHGAVVDGHQPHHARRTSSAGDQRGIHDSKVVQDAEYVVSLLLRHPWQRQSAVGKMGSCPRRVSVWISQNLQNIVKQWQKHCKSPPNAAKRWQRQSINTLLTTGNQATQANLPFCQLMNKPII